MNRRHADCESAMVFCTDSAVDHEAVVYVTGGRIGAHEGAYTAALASLMIPLAAQEREPIIDVHLHALAADAQGPPPLGMCTPVPQYPAWDPRTPYGNLFIARFKRPACADPPMIDDLLAVLYAHPQVYVDVGIIVYNQPRPAFCGYLQAIVDAGFTNRVMFGSDQMVWPGTSGAVGDRP